LLLADVHLLAILKGIRGINDDAIFGADTLKNLK